MIKECHVCGQPINAGMYQMGMWGQYGYQHWTELKARWYMPLDLCPASRFMKSLNLLITKFRKKE